jgi:membrane-associated protein
MAQDALPIREAGRLSQGICAAALVAGIVASYALLAVSPELLAHHDLVLEAATGGITSIVSGGALASAGRQPLFLVVLAPMASVLLYDVFYWWAGRLWGETVIARLVAHQPRWARWSRRAEAMVRRRGIWALIASYYLPIPTVLVQAACGISGMPLWLFLLGDAIALLLWVGLLVGLGYAIGSPAVHVVDAINHDARWVTIGIIVLVLVLATVRQSRRAAVGSARGRLVGRRQGVVDVGEDRDLGLDQPDGHA